MGKKIQQYNVYTGEKLQLKKEKKKEVSCIIQSVPREIRIKPRDFAAHLKNCINHEL